MTAYDHLNDKQFADVIKTAPLAWHIKVGYTTQRPVIPDQHTRDVMVSAQDPHEARLIASQMVGVHKDVVMVTSANVHGATI
jgi:hypothetical protein